MMRILMTAMLLAMAATVAAEDASDPLLTFVLAGQSNMVGKRCQAERLPATFQGENSDALFFQSDTKSWVPIAPGRTERRGFGPEIAFAAAMAKGLKQPIGIIKHSRGGTNLHRQWNPDDPDSLFDELAQKVAAAGQVRPLKVVGMLWVQGGADAKSEAMSKAYAVNLRRLVLRSRATFKNPQMVFLSGRIPAKSDQRKPYWRMVRQAQQDLEIEGYQWVDCDDISTGLDGIHYNTAGMVKLGERQAKLTLAAIGE